MSSTAEKRVYLIRHAEAEHNSTGDLSLLDPPLTAKGRGQAAAIPRESRVPAECDLIVCSPLHRTLETMLLAFDADAIRARGIKVVLLAALQETGPHPCDTGSLDIAKKFADRPDVLDFSGLGSEDGRTDGWTSKKGFWAAESTALGERAAWVRRWLRSRPEKRIAVVSHFGFITQLMGHRPPQGIDNCEVLPHRFAAEQDDQALLEAAPQERTELPNATAGQAAPQPKIAPTGRL